ncbi:regulatory protein GntR, HTH:Aminotransferase, class I and II [Pedobacter sp. BAL39]|uniref:GntR family transcriptional regulator n=1 Tax=Pedobacter sp. BAL39 TaxID=391596 RepID=UPI00015597A8|nr:GntR family transcriptional regulator [Pedobacter sp. BAL39]EDM38900.1 regulatory protein GntR, HTH:Aminotransferase, class I and II [Pedobacter sp. BAL39]
MSERPPCPISPSIDAAQFWNISWQIVKGAKFSQKRQIIEYICKEYATGNHPPMGRMPSINSLSKQIGTDRSNVQKAYHALKKQDTILYGFGKITKMYPLNVQDDEDEPRADDLPIFGNDYDFSFLDQSKLNMLTLGKSGAEMLREAYHEPEQYKLTGSLVRGRSTSQEYILDIGARYLLRNKYITSVRHVCIIPENFALTKVLKSITKSGDHVAMVSYSDYTAMSSIADLNRKLVFTGADEDGMLTDNLKSACLKHTIKAVLIRQTSDFPVPNTLSESRFIELIAMSKAYGFWIIMLDDDHFYRDEPGINPRIDSRRVIYLCHYPAFNPLYNVYLVTGPPHLFDSISRKLARAFATWPVIRQKVARLDESRARLEKEISIINQQRAQGRLAIEKVLSKLITKKVEVIIPRSGTFASIIYQETVPLHITEFTRTSPVFHENENLNHEPDKPVKIVRISLLTTDWSPIHSILEFMNWEK